MDNDLKLFTDQSEVSAISAGKLSKIQVCCPNWDFATSVKRLELQVTPSA